MSATSPGPKESGWMHFLHARTRIEYNGTTIWVVPKIRGPIFVALNIRCCNITYNQKVPIILRTTHIVVSYDYIIIAQGRVSRSDQRECLPDATLMHKARGTYEALVSFIVVFKV